MVDLKDLLFNYIDLHILIKDKEIYKIFVLLKHKEDIIMHIIKYLIYI